MKRVKHICLGLVLAGLWLGGVGNVSAVSDKMTEQESVDAEVSKFSTSGVSSAANVVAAMRLAADWQLRIPPYKKSEADWSYAPFWHGLHELSKLPGCEQYRAKVRDVGRLAQ